MKDNNIVLISSKEPTKEEQGKVTLTYKDGSIEVVEADYMGVSEEMPNFLMLWNETPYNFKGYFNLQEIKKVGTSND